VSYSFNFLLSSVGGLSGSMKDWDGLRGADLFLFLPSAFYGFTALNVLRVLLFFPGKGGRSIGGLAVKARKDRAEYLQMGL
jgi:hypothetical protein